MTLSFTRKHDDLDGIYANDVNELQVALENHDTSIITNTANLTAHVGNLANPHAVTKAQVGLGNVDNTADANKPISGPTQAALDTKANQTSVDAITPTAGHAIVGGPTGPANVIVKTNAAAYSSLSAALAAAGTYTLTVPPGTYTITAPMTPVAGASIEMHPGAVIVQQTKYRPVFDLLDVPGVTIEGGYLQYNGDRTFLMSGAAAGSMRNGGWYSYGSSVWSNSDRTTVRGLRAYGFTAAVQINGWNGTTGKDEAYHTKSCLVEDLDFDTCDFGVLSTGTDELVLRRLRGKYSVQPTGVDGAGPPPHVVYVSGSKGTWYPLNRNLTVEGVETIGDASSNSHIFSLKAVRGARITNIYGRNCGGLVNLVDCQDVTFTKATLLDALTTSGAGQIYFQDQPTDGYQTFRNRFEDIQITMAQDLAERVVRLDGTRNEIINLRIMTKLTTYAGSGTHDVIISGGDGNRLINPDFENIGPGSVEHAIQVAAGRNHEVINPSGRNLRNLVYVATGAIGCTVDYDPHRFRPQGTIQRLTVNATSGTYQLQLAWGTTQTSAAIAYNATDAQIRSTLEAMSNIVAGNVDVVPVVTDPLPVGQTPPANTWTYDIVFRSQLDTVDVPAFTVTGSTLAGGTGVTVTKTQSGLASAPHNVWNTEPTTRLSMRERVAERKVSSGALRAPGGVGLPQIKPNFFTHYRLTVTDTTGFTIGAPEEPTKGQRLTFEVVNNSGGTLGTVTWDASYWFQTAWANPPSGSRQTVTFLYDGSVWAEVSRSG